jgi:Flp pilus assembly protein TadG
MAPITPLRLSRGERGAALVEFALVLPLLLVVIAGVVDFGFLFQRYEVVTNAAREGARLASLPSYNGQTALIRAHVRNYVQQGLALSTAALNATVPNTAAGVDITNVTLSYTANGNTYQIPAVSVTVNYNHTFLLLGPVLGLIGGTWGNSMNIVGFSQMRLEAAGTGS